jgi:hypothetical protein
MRLNPRAIEWYHELSGPHNRYGSLRIPATEAAAAVEAGRVDDQQPTGAHRIRFD